MYSVNRVMRSILLVALFAGSPYGPQIFLDRPGVLQYQRWFGRWIPERSNP